jgi:hypothetical protein
MTSITWQPADEVLDACLWGIHNQLLWLRYYVIFPSLSQCGSLPQGNEHYQIGTQNVSPDAHWVAHCLATAGSKRIKTWLPGTAVTVAIAPTMRQHQVHLSSNHWPDCSGPTPPAFANSHELCWSHRSSSLSKLRHSSLHRQTSAEKLDWSTATARSFTAKCAIICLHNRPFSGPAVSRWLHRSSPARMFNQ